MKGVKMVELYGKKKEIVKNVEERLNLKFDTVEHKIFDFEKGGKTYLKFVYNGRAGDKEVMFVAETLLDIDTGFKLYKKIDEFDVIVTAVEVRGVS